MDTRGCRKSNSFRVVAGSRLLNTAETELGRAEQNYVESEIL